MVCPKCGSDKIQAVNVQEVTGGVTTKSKGKSKGFGWCKGCLMTCVIGPFGWLCGLCGMGKGKSKTTTVDNRKTTNTIQYCCLNCGNQFKQ